MMIRVSNQFQSAWRFKKFGQVLEVINNALESSNPEQFQFSSLDISRLKHKDFSTNSFCSIDVKFNITCTHVCYIRGIYSIFKDNTW